MPTRRHPVAVILMSGAIAGFGGAMELAGTVTCLGGGISNNYGYPAIMVAVLARAQPVGVPFSPGLMAVILSGGIILQTRDLTMNTVLAIAGPILLHAAVAEELAHYRLVRTA